MTDFFSQIILDLQERIGEQVPEIRYIDQNLGQLAHTGEDDRPPLAYPAVLIDFPNTTYTELGDGGQLGLVQVSFLLVMDTYSQTWNEAPEAVRRAGMDYLQAERQLVAALHGWALDYFTPLSRQSVRSQNNNDVGLRVRELIFTTEYEDWPAEQEVCKTFEIAFQGGIKI